MKPNVINVIRANDNSKTEKSENEQRENKELNLPASSNLLNDPLDFSIVQNPKI